MTVTTKPENIPISKLIDHHTQACNFLNTGKCRRVACRDNGCVAKATVEQLQLYQDYFKRWKAWEEGYVKRG